MATITAKTIRYLLDLYHNNPKDYDVSALTQLVKDKPDETPLSLLDENDVIAVKYWTKNDFLKNANDFIDGEIVEIMENHLPVYGLLENICDKAIQNPDVKRLNDCTDEEWYIIRDAIEAEIKELYPNREMTCEIIVTYPDDTVENFEGELDPLTHMVSCPTVKNKIDTAIKMFHMSSTLIKIQVIIPATATTTGKEITCPLYYYDSATVTEDMLKNISRENIETFYILY